MNRGCKRERVRKFHQQCVCLRDIGAKDTGAKDTDTLPLHEGMERWNEHVSKIQAHCMRGWKDGMNMFPRYTVKSGCYDIYYYLENVL